MTAQTHAQASAQTLLNLRTHTLSPFVEGESVGSVCSSSGTAGKTDGSEA